MRNARLMIAIVALTLSGVAGAAHGMTPAFTCKDSPSIDVSTIKSQIVLVGEVHGTNEIPTYVSELACALLKRGDSVLLALEKEQGSQLSTDTYLDSAGTRADQSALLASRSWQRSCDGKRSVAMLRLFEQFRALRAGGARVGILNFYPDTNAKFPVTPAELSPLPLNDNKLINAIDEESAANLLLRAAILYRKYTLLVLSSYSHTASVLDPDSDASYKPMGFILESHYSPYTIYFRSAGGEHWAASAKGCGPVAILRGNLFESGTRIDRLVDLGKVTSSPPAKDALD